MVRLARFYFSGRRVSVTSSGTSASLGGSRSGGRVMDAETNRQLADVGACPLGVLARDEVDDRGGGEASLGMVRKPSHLVHSL